MSEGTDDIRWVKQNDMFIHVWWNFYRFNDEVFDWTCLYVLDRIPSNLFGFYWIKKRIK